MDDCEICNGRITDLRRIDLGEPPPEDIRFPAIRKAGFKAYDLCWDCWDGISAQYEAEKLGLLE